MPSSTPDILLRKGRDVARGALLEEAKIALGLARMHAEALAGAGWSTKQAKQLGAHLDALSAAVGAHHEQRLMARSATEREAEARRVAMRFLKHLRNAVPLALRTSTAKVKPEAFRVGVPLGRSTPRIAAHLTKLAGPVTKLDADLAPYFGGKRASDRLRETLALLSKRDVEQEVQRQASPRETERLYRAAGEVLQDLEDLHRVARIAFDEQPEIRRAFRKKKLAKGRRAGKGAQGGAAGAGAGAAAGAPLPTAGVREPAIRSES